MRILFGPLLPDEPDIDEPDPAIEEERRAAELAREEARRAAARRRGLRSTILTGGQEFNPQVRRARLGGQ